jgi:hypothetical protein
MSYLQALNAGLLTNANGQDPLVIKYETLTYPITSPASVGYYYIAEEVNDVALNNSGAWTLLYTDPTEYPAGIYMLSLSVLYTDTSSVITLTGTYNGLSIGIVDDPTASLKPEEGFENGSSLNIGSINMTLPFISDGTTDKNRISITYNSNIANVTVKKIKYVLTRIG